jgi:hypothetical protein
MKKIFKFSTFFEKGIFIKKKVQEKLALFKNHIFAF